MSYFKVKGKLILISILKSGFYINFIERVSFLSVTHTRMDVQRSLDTNIHWCQDNGLLILASDWMN